MKASDLIKCPHLLFLHICPQMFPECRHVIHTRKTFAANISRNSVGLVGHYPSCAMWTHQRRYVAASMFVVSQKKRTSCCHPVKDSTVGHLTANIGFVLMPLRKRLAATTHGLFDFSFCPLRGYVKLLCIYTSKTEFNVISRLSSV